MDEETEHSFNTVIGNTIDADSWSLFGEAHVELLPRLSLLLSGRIDKHEFAEPAYSPRVALISPLDERNIVHLIWQRSVRLPVFTDMYVEHEEFGSSARYKKADMNFGATYSYINQLDWEDRRNNDAFINEVGSRTDVLGPLMDNAENRINNLPGHALKFFYAKDLPHDLKLHLDARVYWDYNQNDMLDMFKEAHDGFGTDETRAEMQAIYDDVRDKGYGKASFTSNASLGWKLPLTNVDCTAWLYARNLLSYNHMRYMIQFWETGNLRQYPRQVSFIEEPITVGVKLNFTF